MKRNALNGTVLFTLRWLVHLVVVLLGLRCQYMLRSGEKGQGDRKQRPRDQQQCWVGNPAGVCKKNTFTGEPKTLVPTVLQNKVDTMKPKSATTCYAPDYADARQRLSLLTLCVASGRRIKYALKKKKEHCDLDSLKMALNNVRSNLSTTACHSTTYVWIS